MPTRRYGLALVTLGCRIYAIGGDDGDQVCVANEVYDPQTNSWSRAADLPRPLAGGKAEAHNGLIYYVGGCDQFEAMSAETYVYCSATDRWDFALVPGTKDKLCLKIPRTSFAMTLLDVPPGDGPSWLMVTGGIAVRPDEFFLTDTELLPIGTAAVDSGSTAPRLTETIVPRMPHPRSGCRSVAFWPPPGRYFQPWAADPVRGPDSRLRNAKPFVVVLGGETLEDDHLIPCEDPLVLDVARGQWLTHTRSPMVTEGTSHQSFFSLVGKLRMSRVAFAIATAPGLPNIAAHGG